MAIKGDTIIVSIWDTTATAYKPIACLTDNSLSQTRNIVESQTKCLPGQTEKTAGSLNYNISADGEYIDTTSVGGDTAKASHDYLFGLMNSGEKFNWRMSTGLADTSFYYGEAILGSLDLTSPAGDGVSTFTTTLEGSGAIVLVDPLA